MCHKKSSYISGLKVLKLPRHLQASTSNENDSALRNELVYKDRTVNMNMLIILILMITNFKWFFIKMLDLFLNKQKPYNHSNHIHKR